MCDFINVCVLYKCLKLSFFYQVYFCIIILAIISLSHVIQMADAIDYETIMNFGYVIRKYEFDFGGSECNTGKFTLAVTQDEAPDTIGTEIKFEAEFESKVSVGIACDEGAMAVPGDIS